MRCDRCGAQDRAAKSYTWIFGASLGSVPTGGQWQTTYSNFQPISAAMCTACLKKAQRKDRLLGFVFAPIGLASFAFLVITIVRQQPGEDIKFEALISLFLGFAFTVGAIRLLRADPASLVVEEASRKAREKGLTHFRTPEDFAKLQSSSPPRR